LNLTEEQRDYYIKLGKYLEYQKVEEEHSRLLKQKEEIAEIFDKLREAREVTKRHKELKHLQHCMKEYQYNKEHPDPDIDLGNGMVKVTLWKSLPTEDKA
jgi:hypothetical protein